MRQLVQSVRSGELRIVDGPDPTIGATEVLVEVTRSLVSAGTERAVRELASKNLLQKARARPDLVRQVVRRARLDGVRSTLDAVRTRLDDEMPLGYSATGRVLAVGEAVTGVRPGQRVATGGAGHGDLQVVAGLLAVPVPDEVTDEQAAFATIASVALHGLRLADVGTGGTVCVVGLGLIGQLTVRLALASGLQVIGVDVRDWTVDRARAAGAHGDVERGDDTTALIREWSRGRGVDAVLLTASTGSSDPVRHAPARLRDRGTIVVVGDVGLDLQRTPLYEKEITLKVARSYGPGRYEREYEEWGIDLPVGHVRFTEGRNLESVLDLMASGRLVVDDLVSHRVPFEQAIDAYAVIADPTQQYLGVQLLYSPERPARTPAPGNVAPTASRQASVALIGAGNFARGVLVPAVQHANFGTVVSVSSAGGVSAQRLAERIGARAVSTDEALAAGDGHAEVVMIATSHDSHAALAVRALQAGRHVFCEKPLAITDEELEAVRGAWTASGRQLAVGFNRRHSPDVQRARQVFGVAGGPLVITYRVNAGTLPASHWYHDRRQGGRLLGEVCHFIDTCMALVGRPVLRVAATGSATGEAALVDDIGVLLGFDDGSIATIAYGSGGHANTAKERIEILGRGHTVVIDDFRSIEVDGSVDRHPQDKGHVAQLHAFARDLRSAGTAAGEAAIATTEVALRAVAALSVDGNGLPGDARIPQ
ncbi:MAG: bi-domain-containing oxidoreductase [Ilumatobacteraceae bacterium]